MSVSLMVNFTVARGSCTPSSRFTSTSPRPGTPCSATRQWRFQAQQCQQRAQQATFQRGKRGHSHERQLYGVRGPSRTATSVGIGVNEFVVLDDEVEAASVPLPRQQHATRSVKMIERPSEHANGLHAVAAREIKDGEAVAARAAIRKRHRNTYMLAAGIGTTGVIFIMCVSVIYRFTAHGGGDASAVPVTDFVFTLLLTVGAMCGMELYARLAHKNLWHGPLWDVPAATRRGRIGALLRPIWGLHRSHHEPREGLFEANDIFAIANAVPAIACCIYGLYTPGIFGSICFGTGLGISLYGICYLFIHDGLVHKRFPTGPIGRHPYMKRVACAHKIHHGEKFGGVPYGLFLGPMELAAVKGGTEELEMQLARSREDK